MLSRLGFGKSYRQFVSPVRKMSNYFTADSQTQPVTTPITTSTIFLTLTFESPLKADVIKKTLSQLHTYKREINSQYPESNIVYVAGLGTSAWQSLFGKTLPQPKDLHDFKALKGAGGEAPSTPGDLFLHIRSEEMAVCFEFAARIAEQLGDAAKIVDEVHSFKYHDSRNVLGFVDGSGNPETPEEVQESTVITSKEDDKFVGGSYVITQKYFHDMAKWKQLPVDYQENIIGRHKKSDEEFDDDAKKSWAHNNLTEIIDENGEQHEILRDNMPFGDISKNEFGTFFIGYSKRPWVTEKMLDNMFIGDPVGNYDRLLDYSTAVTGNLFFCPTLDFLEHAEQF